MRLYHVSYMPVNSFYPRVPRNRLPNEDSVTPRICFAPSIEQCVNAKPYPGDFIGYCLEDNQPCLLFVYSFDYDPDRDDFVISPEELSEARVYDALWSEEHWATAVPSNLEEHIYRVVDAFYEDDSMMIRRLILDDDILPEDWLLVDIVEEFNARTGKHQTPDQALPQIWERMREENLFEG